MSYIKDYIVRKCVNVSVFKWKIKIYELVSGGERVPKTFFGLDFSPPEGPEFLGLN